MCLFLLSLLLPVDSSFIDSFLEPCLSVICYNVMFIAFSFYPSPLKIGMGVGGGGGSIVDLACVCPSLPQSIHIACPHEDSWTRWRHQMETFSALLPFCTVNSPVTGEFPTQRLRLRLRQVYSTKIYTSTISGLHEFLRNTNNTIVLIYK